MAAEMQRQVMAHDFGQMAHADTLFLDGSLSSHMQRMREEPDAMYEYLRSLPLPRPAYESAAMSADAVPPPLAPAPLAVTQPIPRPEPEHAHAPASPSPRYSQEAADYDRGGPEDAMDVS